jgi:hypothetical protein
MTFTKTLAVGTFLASTLIAGTALAKGHDQGFGNQTAGRATSGGAVAAGQTNRDGDGSATSYGATDASLEAKAGTQDNSEVAQMRDGSHPSQTKGN